MSISRCTTVSHGEKEKREERDRDKLKGAAKLIIRGVFGRFHRTMKREQRDPLEHLVAKGRARRAEGGGDGRTDSAKLITR